MTDYSIRTKCKVNTNIDSDTFVGVVCEKGDISIHFPLGFRLSDEDKELRRDIILLLSTISSTVGRKDSQILKDSKSYDEVGFPLQAYMHVVADYVERGYYKEKETQYSVSTKGKINWGRTIKTQKPFIQGTDAYYLKFVTRKNPVSENELITLIHEYCVYESFLRIGWLFTSFIPRKPRIKFNNKLFRNTVMNKYQGTFNDKNKRLFKSMLAIIDDMQNSNADISFRYGTYRFEYVWEALIDRVYGIEGKDAYFPKTTWKIGNKTYDNASLEPDSIMLWGGDVYVLDAKYYKYGASRRMNDLPESTSINKQITYGEYIAQDEKFRKIHGDNFTIYNAFLMPYDAIQWKTEGTMLHIGEALSNWKTNGKVYERVQGILIDIKQLMNTRIRMDEIEIEKLAICIAEGVEKGAD